MMSCMFSMSLLTIGTNAYILNLVKATGEEVCVCILVGEGGNIALQIELILTYLLSFPISLWVLVN